MQHLEYAQAALTAFTEYSNLIEPKEDTVLRLDLCSDGSGCVRDLEKQTILFEFDDLKQLLVLLLVNQLGMKNISKP